MDKIALIIIYNHQFNKNIDVLEKIYKNRFSNIYHLVPFYKGSKENVIPVYESSHYFQGYVSQGIKAFFKEEFSHYFFVADDLMINPNINENNLSNYFNLKKETCYIPGFITLHECESWWQRVSEAYHWNINVLGVEAKNQLPSKEAAEAKFKKFNLSLHKLLFKQIWKTPSKARDFAKIIIKDTFYPIRFILYKLKLKTYKLKYPMVGAYSDIFIVNSDTMKEFGHNCGVFAATKLFVELAIPTSMVLSANEIVTEEELSMKGRTLWTNEDLKELDKYEESLDTLFQEFPEDYLYIHPIKLSKWSKL